MSFADFALNAALLRGIEALGFSEPTPIQRDALPLALAGRDVLGCAMTGSGKTAAFALPVLQRLMVNRRPGPRALVLTPTRELAAQVHEHFEALGHYSGVSSVAVFGGVRPGPQERALRAGVDVLVATPGRLLDHMQHSYWNLDALEVLVLDEADRMLDMGFLPDVRRILARVPRLRQTMFFSATMPDPIIQLSRDMLIDPVRIGTETKQAPATGIKHAVYPVVERLKPSLLLALLNDEVIDAALVFTRTKHRANRLADYLDAKGISCDRIHGNRSQPQREAALAAFKDHNIRVLVATDIAARGIDVEALPCVVNFDVPGQAEDYIHRVGRTARARLSGEAITLATPEDAREIAAIERAMGQRLPRRHHEEFDYQAQPEGRLEIPIAERIAAIRSRRADERARAAEKAARRGSQPLAPSNSTSRPADSRSSSSRPRNSQPLSSRPNTPANSAPGRSGPSRRGPR